MGVPKFYRWISERYPMINQMISTAAILPEIDNFYLDMNGIIHACTHPSDNMAANSLSQREMMLSIFRYIDRIVSEIVKPKKLLFMAIDGVAPRAKLNQQRARRFRAAQDRLESVEKAKERGEIVDEDNMFDSNCITPGTEFMEMIGKHLRWFIRKKIKEDPLWRNLTVVFSGHDVPGEGEHKIMQYIRDLRAGPSYEPNLRHCMYGQDADLIMLGLASHEPHFCLLREVINFNVARGRKPARETVMRQTEDAQFQLLHLSVLREYLALDFAYGIEHLIDQERVIDDFIFLTFLVGNDFLPHLPTLDISEHAFDVLINSYRQLFVERPGYIVDCGEIADYERLEALFAIIGSQETDILANREQTEKEYNQRRRKYKDNNQANQLTEEELEAKEEEMQIAFEAALKEAMGLAADGDEGEGDENEDEDHSEADVNDGEALEPISKKDYRGRYYYEKFKIFCGTNEGDTFLTTLMGQYLKGLGWCLAYYIKGCISWTWYYPYHYGPMLQDMVNLHDLRAKITYDLGHPFTPFQQLLGCLPPASAILLPKCYQWMMTSPDSPVLDCYPLDFKIDQDGKKNPWEAVVLLDFIDEVKLLRAEATYCPVSKLTRHETARNAFGYLLTHIYDLKMTETYLSCNPEIGLADIHTVSSSVTESVFDLTPGHYFKAELMPGTVYPIAGFPSLTVLPLQEVVVDAIKLNVFGSESRYKSVVLGISSAEVNELDEKTALKMLGKSVYINYPQMHEAKVVALTTSTAEFRLAAGQGQVKTVVKTIHDTSTATKWQEYVEAETEKYLKGRGRPGSGGLSIGQTYLRLKVQPLQGMKRDPVSGARKKIFSSTSEADVPLQLALWKPSAMDVRFIEVDELPVKEMMPINSQVVAIAGSLTGLVGTVIGPHYNDPNMRKVNNKKRVIDVEFTVPNPEPPFGYTIAAAMRDEYYSSRDICSILHITPSTFGKIVGSVRVEPGRFDFGLNLKRNGVHQLLGYVRKVEPAANSNNSGHNTRGGGGSKGAAISTRRVWTGIESVKVIGMLQENGKENNNDGEAVYWEYTQNAVNLLIEYKARFPYLFQQLDRMAHEPVYTITVLLGSNGDQLGKEIMAWMQEQPFFYMPRVPLTTKALSKEAMAAIERASDVHTTLNRTEGVKKWIVKSVPIEKVFNASFYTSTEVSLTYNQLEPRLGDRVVNLCSSGVPFGLRGTVVIIHAATKYVEVIFDEEFIGGKSLQGYCSQFRGRLCRWTDLLMISIRKDPSTVAAERVNGGVDEKKVIEQSTQKLLSVLKTKPATGAVTPEAPVAWKNTVYIGEQEYDEDETDAFLAALVDEQQQKLVEKAILAASMNASSHNSGSRSNALKSLLGKPADENSLALEGRGTSSSAFDFGLHAPSANEMFKEAKGNTTETAVDGATNKLKSMLISKKPASSVPAAAQGPKTSLNVAATERLLKHELGLKPQSQPQQQQQQQHDSKKANDKAPKSTQSNAVASNLIAAIGAGKVSILPRPVLPAEAAASSVSVPVPAAPALQLKSLLKVGNKSDVPEAAALVTSAPAKAKASSAAVAKPVNVSSLSVTVDIKESAKAEMNPAAAATASSSRLNSLLKNAKVAMNKQKTPESAVAKERPPIAQPMAASTQLKSILRVVDKSVASIEPTAVAAAMAEEEPIQKVSVVVVSAAAPAMTRVSVNSLFGATKAATPAPADVVQASTPSQIEEKDESVAAPVIVAATGEEKEASSSVKKSTVVTGFLPSRVMLKSATKK